MIFQFVLSDGLTVQSLATILFGGVRLATQVPHQRADVSYHLCRYLSMQQHDVCIFSISIHFPSSQALEWQQFPISGMLIIGKLRRQGFVLPPRNLTRTLGSRGDTRGRLRMPCASMAMSCASLQMNLFSSPRKRS